MRSTLFTLLAAATLATSARAQAPAPAGSWDIIVGGGAIAIPAYPGSEDHRVYPFPLAKISWRDRAYFGPSAGGNGLGIGVYALRTSTFRLSAEAGFVPDRPHDRADALAGMDDRSVVATATIAATYAFGPIEFSTGLTQGLNDGAGLMGGPQLSVTLPVTPRTILIPGYGVTFANAKQMRREFGVTPLEAARRQALIDAGDDRLGSDAGTPYMPKGGLRNTNVSLTLIQFLTANWAVIGIGGVERLSDEAAASSVVRKETQLTGGLALGYRF